MQFFLERLALAVDTVYEAVVTRCHTGGRAAWLKQGAIVTLAVVAMLGTVLRKVAKYESDS